MEEAVPNTLPGNSKALVAKRVVCALNSARFVEFQSSSGWQMNEL